jgi:hypothetical protein
MTSEILDPRSNRDARDFDVYRIDLKTGHCLPSTGFLDQSYRTSLKWGIVLSTDPDSFHPDA